MSASPSSSKEEESTLARMAAESPVHRRELREMLSASYFSGPLPPPDLLEQYDRIVPDFSRTLLENWRDQTEHRMALESAVVESNIRQADRGLIAGVIVALAGLGASVAMAVVGAETAASIVGGATLVSLVGTFVYGSHHRAKERENKQEIMARIQGS